MTDVPQTLAIIGGTIVDGNGGVPVKDGVIVIEGSRIIAMGDHSTQIPPRATKIVVNGKFVIPGLMTAMVYLINSTSPTVLIRYEGKFDELAIEAAQIALRGGLTSVFDVWGPRDSLIKARNAINQGKVAGARIYVAGNIVGHDGPFSEDFRPKFREAVTDVFATRIDSQWQLNVGAALLRMAPEQVRDEVRKYVHSGIDFLNYAVTDHRLGAFQYIVFSPRVQQLIVEEAHRVGLPVMGFFPSTSEGLNLALNAGVDLTAVGPLLSDISTETVDFIAKHQTPCGLMPDTAKVLEWYRERVQTNASYKSYEVLDVNNRKLIDAGAVPLLFAGGGVFGEEEMSSWKGSLPPEEGFISLGESHVYRLLALQDRGVKPMAALMSATRNVARAYKLDKDLGTLERGKLADLVVLDRNPLEDANNYRCIHLVMKDGKVVDRSTLPTRPLITAC